MPTPDPRTLFGHCERCGTRTMKFGPLCDWCEEEDADEPEDEERSE